MKQNVAPFSRQTETVVTGHVSLVIAIVLVLQLVATFDLFPLFLSRPSRLFWPFMDYPMYRSARYEGSLMEWYRVLGRRADGSEIEVTPDDLGLNVRRFRDVVIAAIRGADLPRVAAFAEIYRLRTGTRLAAIRLEQHGYILTREGLRPAPTTRLADMSLATQ